MINKTIDSYLMMEKQLIIQIQYLNNSIGDDKLYKNERQK